MKRTVTSVLFFALCLVFCACGHTAAPNPTHVSVPTPETTHDPAEILPDHNTDPDGETGPGTEPAPSVVEVEITADNLWDYFEIVKDRTEKKDSKGKLYYLYVARRLNLKKEYTLADGEEYPTDVTVEFEFDNKFTCYRKPCTIDYKNFKATGKVWSQDQTHESQIAHFPYSPSLDCSWADADPGNKDSPSVVSSSSNFKLISAGGKLCLIKK